MAATGKATAALNVLEAFDLGVRERAAAIGRPVMRLSGPAIPGYLAPRASTTLVWREGGGLRTGRTTLDSIARGDEAVENIVLAVNSVDAGALPRIVYADRQTFNLALNRVLELARVQRTLGNYDPNAAYRRMRFADGLPLSGSTTILTDALARKYAAQQGINVADLAGWAAAFGRADATSAPDGMVDLLGPLCATDGQLGYAAKYMNAMLKDEESGLKASGYASLTAAGTAFSYATRATDAAGAYLALDPLMRERNVIAGMLHEVWVSPEARNRQTASTMHFDAILPETFTIEPGREVLVINPESGVQHSLGLRGEVVRNSDGRVERVGRFAGYRTTGVKAIPAIMADQPERLLIFEPPYLPFGATSGPKRWTKDRSGREVPGGAMIPRREIPLAVAIAGAPVAKSRS